MQSNPPPPCPHLSASEPTLLPLAVDVLYGWPLSVDRHPWTRPNNMVSKITLMPMAHKKISMYLAQRRLTCIMSMKMVVLCVALVSDTVKCFRSQMCKEWYSSYLPSAFTARVKQSVSVSQTSFSRRHAFNNKQKYWYWKFVLQVQLSTSTCVTRATSQTSAWNTQSQNLQTPSHRTYTVCHVGNSTAPVLRVTDGRWNQLRLRRHIRLCSTCQCSCWHLMEQ